MQKQKCTFYTKKRSFSREKAKHLTVSLYTLCILRNTYQPSSSLYVLCIVSMNDDLVCRRPCLILLTYNLVNGCKRQLVNTDSHLNWKRFKHARRWPHSSYYAAIQLAKHRSWVCIDVVIPMYKYVLHFIVAMLLCHKWPQMSEHNVGHVTSPDI